MPKYRALRTCFHNAHLFQAGDVAAFDDPERVPYHFEPLDGAPEPTFGLRAVPASEPVASPSQEEETRTKRPLTGAAKLASERKAAKEKASVETDSEAA